MSVRIITTVFYVLFGCTCYSQQNLKADYKPLKSLGILPSSFIKPVKETVAEGMKDLNQVKDSSSKVKAELLIHTNYQIDWMIKSGNTLINDEITSYLNDIGDILLKDQPEERKKIHIYTAKSSVVNAFTFYNGSMFVDLGYLARVENEAQLAYVMCHELTHYFKQHHVSGGINYEKLESTADGKSDEDVFKEICLFSRTQESEADSGGLVLYRKTNYDLAQALKTFDILQYDYLPFELAPFDKSFFETPGFIIPDKYVLKDLTPVKEYSAKDDELRTHPDPVKRKEAISTMIGTEQKGVKNILGEARFTYIRDLARFEICRLMLCYRDYNGALYAAYTLSKKYPDNLYLAQIISKCLYAISLNHTGYLRYNRGSYLDGPIHYMQVESYQQQLYYLINKMTDSEWNILSLNYVYRKHKKYPDDPVLLALSDSLFKTMYYVNANFETPGTKQYFTNLNQSTDTSGWYKKVFIDVFNDPEFAEKFPETIGNEFVIPYTPKSYHKNRFEKKMRIVENISKVLCLPPSYAYFDDSELQSLYERAVDDQKYFLTTFKNCSAKQNFEVVILDPHNIDSTEVGKINDYSVITDWLNECSDGDENEKMRVPIFNTDELKTVANRYGTSHVLLTGFAVMNGKSKYSVFYSVVYDLKENRQVYINQQYSKGKPTKADIESKVCAMFHELKYGEGK